LISYKSKTVKKKDLLLETFQVESFKPSWGPVQEFVAVRDRVSAAEVTEIFLG
jgi:hypothetical protein